MKNSKYVFVLSVVMALTGCNQNQSTPTPPVSDTEDTNSEVTTPPITTPPPITEEGSATASDTSVTQTYNVLLDASYPPFAFEGADGDIQGFDLDILNAAGEAAGFNTNFSSDYWDGIFTKLNDGSSDIIASGIPLTAQAQTEALFSDPYIEQRTVILYNNAQPQTFAQLAQGMIAVEMGSPVLVTLHDLNVDDSHIIEYPTSADALPDLISGEVGAIVEDEAIMRYQLKSSSLSETDANQIKSIDLPNTEQGARAFAIKQGRTHLAEQLNKGLAIINQNGEYDVIYQKWFGELPRS